MITQKFDVFLSHSSQNLEQVEQIAKRLEDEAGLRPFLDKWHLVPGESWQDAMEEALDASKTVAVFLGPDGLGPWENKKMNSALVERIKSKSLRIIPILLPGANLKENNAIPQFLRRLTWVDFHYGTDDSIGFARLVAAIKNVSMPSKLAQLLQTTNRLAETEPLMRRALEIDERSFGPDHPNVAIRLNNLAQLLQTTNRLAEAEPLMRRALEIDEQSFGPDHPNVAIDLNNLAILLQTSNRLAEAESLMQRVIKIFRYALGAEHPSVATALENYASLLRVIGKNPEAEKLEARALAIRKK